MKLMKTLTMLKAAFDGVVSLNDLNTPYDTFSCFWSSLEQGYGGPSYLPSLPPLLPPEDVT